MARICTTAEYSFNDGTKARWEYTEQHDEFGRKLKKVILSREGDKSFHETSYTTELPTLHQSLHLLKNFFKDHPELK